MTGKGFIAIDLGATSGRTILGTISRDGLSLREVARFPNAMVSLGGHSHWNIFSLYEQIVRSLATAAGEASRAGIDTVSVGIDTWGVDFAFIGPDGELLGMPYAYRDAALSDAHTEYFERVMSRDELYARTGIEVMNINSLFQLHARRRDGSTALKAADKILFMPDALGWMLTGRMATEYTIASTSQLLDPHTGKMDVGLLASVGLSPDVFPPLVMPGARLGPLRPDIARETGLRGVDVISVAGHDTASAVAAIPAADERFAYISSGTWSLMGIELPGPLITPATSRHNVSGEGGVDGTTRLLKNITGMWILEQCLAEWKRAGTEYTYAEMVEEAIAAPRFAGFIDPDDPAFASPPSMLRAIDDHMSRTGQTPPQAHGALIRIILESLALKYRTTLDLFRTLAPFPIERLHVIGGGSRNTLLNRFTANATGLPVVAGPSEATAIGNIMLQARSAGMAGSLSDMRAMIAAVVDPRLYEPRDTDEWSAAHARYLEILNITN